MADSSVAQRDEPVTPAGRLFLQPEVDQVLNCALVSEHPIPLDSVKSDIQNSILLTHPRFCSVVVRDYLGRQRWRKTQVDVDRHLLILHQPVSDDPSISDEDAVNDYLANLAFSSPLSSDKPLWEIHILVAHKTAVFRVHHAIGDGIAIMSLFLSHCRRLDDPTQAPTIGVVDTRSFWPRRWSVWTLVKLVWFTLRYVLEFALRLLWVRDKTTAVSGGSGVELWPRKLATARFRLDDMKTVKRAVANSLVMGMFFMQNKQTINDVLFGVISSGLSRYLDIRSHKAMQDGDRITGVAMVNLRQQDVSKLMDSKLANLGGNKFGVILFPVYYHRGGSDPLRFVKRAKAMIDRKKLSLEAFFSYKLSHLLTSYLGAKVTGILNYRALCNTTFTVSNVVGPQERITFVGNVVKYIRVTSSGLPHAVTMHMVSYAGVADMQILVAKDVIPDPKVLAKCFEDALSEMKEAAEAAIRT